MLDNLGATAATPVTNHLLNVINERKTQYLREDNSKIFYHTVAQLMFMSYRARQDIQTVVGFLTMNVNKSEDYYWVKLKRVLKYFNGMRELKLTLSVDDMSVVKWWVDASYAVHE